MNLTELRQKKGELANQAQLILDAAAKEGRMALRAEENEKFDAIHAEIETVSGTIGRLEKQAALAETTGQRSEPVQPQVTRAISVDPRGAVRNEDRAEALRTWFLAPNPDSNITDAQRDAARRAGVNLDSKFLRIRFAPIAPRSAKREDMREWEQRALLVGSTSPDSGGRFTVPDETMRALEEAMLAFGGMRNVSTVIRTATGADLPFPTVNDTSNKGAILTEGSQATLQDPTFASLILQSYKYSSKEIKTSIEFLQDTSINAAEVIGRLLGQRIGRITNDHFTTGTGSSQPNGVITAATSSSVTAASATTISYDNLIDLEHSVDPAYRENGRFMFSDASLKVLKKIKIPQYSGDTAGQPLWRPGLSAGVPDTIDNYPYTINQSMPAPTTGLKAVAFGDFSKYLIRDVLDVTLVRLDELYAEFGEVAFLAFSRHDGDLLDAGTHPVKYLTMA